MKLILAYIFVIGLFLIATSPIIAILGYDSVRYLYALVAINLIVGFLFYIIND